MTQIKAEGYAQVSFDTTLTRQRCRVSGADQRRGVFASVVGAVEVESGRDVAIKLSHANEAMRRAEMCELAVIVVRPSALLGAPKQVRSSQFVRWNLCVCRICRANPIFRLRNTVCLM